MEIILSLSSVLILLVVSVYKLNPYLKLILGCGMLVAIPLSLPVVIHSPLFIAQGLVLIILVACTFVEKFNDQILDLIFLAVPCLLLISETSLVETFYILNLTVFALYFHSRESLDRGLLKYAYSFSASLDYLFISILSARYFSSISEITFSEVEYYLRDSESLYLLALPIASILLKTLTPLFCQSSLNRTQYYRYYLLQGFFLMSPMLSHKDLFIEGLKTNYYVWSLIALLIMLVVFFVRTHRSERILLFGLYTIFISTFAFDSSMIVLMAFSSIYLIHQLLIRTLSDSHRDLVDVLFGILISSIYIHLAITNSNLSLVFVLLALFQFFYTLSPMLIIKPQEELR